MCCKPHHQQFDIRKAFGMRAARLRRKAAKTLVSLLKTARRCHGGSLQLTPRIPKTIRETVTILVPRKGGFPKIVQGGSIEARAEGAPCSQGRRWNIRPRSLSYTDPTLGAAGTHTLRSKAVRISQLRTLCLGTLYPAYIACRVVK